MSFQQGQGRCFGDLSLGVVYDIKEVREDASRNLPVGHETEKQCLLVPAAGPTQPSQSRLSVAH